MAVSIKKYVDVESRALTKSADGSAYDKLLDGILENPKFQSAVLSAPSGLSDSTKESLDDYGSAETIGDALETIATAALSPMVAATHSQLLQMATNGQLMPGCQYRITDYVATTNGTMNSRSANHPFDIIVVADSATTLNEHARAVVHEGDLPDDIMDGSTRTKYFASCDLAAWDVWYCLDNDTGRFEWADATNGKGVIYRLVDEFQNDCPYDFKGIQFKAYGDTDNVWRYTFDSGAVSTDYSLPGSDNYVHSNKISPYLPDGIKQALNRIVFKGSGCYHNTFGMGCCNNRFGKLCYHNTFGTNCGNNTFASQCCDNTFDSACGGNTFGPGCDNNTFGSDCQNNTFGSICKHNTFASQCCDNTFASQCCNNTFGTNCGNNTFGIKCEANTFGGVCLENTFGSECDNNTFGSDCFNNTFESLCSHNMFGPTCGNNTFGMGCFNNTFASICVSNTFDRECGNNTFGPECNNNTFGPECIGNTFGAICGGNTFGAICGNNTFGANCGNNTFGANCQHNTFGADCGYVKFGTANAAKSYCRYIRIASGNKYLYINPIGATSSSNYYQNVEIKEGVNNSNTYKTITDDAVNQNFTTTYCASGSKSVEL